MQLYNSLSRKTQEFQPIKKGQVGMYHCGPTVYNYAHIGNLRAYTFADTIKRAFKYLGFSVKQVINITDVGHLTGDADQGRDKVEIEAAKEHKTATEIVNFYTEAFFEDLKKINVDIEETLFPKATDHIPEQIELIQKLEKKGLVYKTSDGVYFDSSLFKDYGKLGNIDLANQEEGARVLKNHEKKNPTDFAVWKFSPPESSGEKRQQEWSSPWGVGFPGWHIECSAMSMKYLGETFDIHTGGVDHIPIHHNNEIAQSESSTGKEYAKFWLHSAFVNAFGEKMSKSMENFIRLNTLEERGIHPLAYRYWLLTAHYRSPVLFSFEAVQAAQNALESVVLKISMGKRKKLFGKIFGSSKRENEVRNQLRKIIENDLDTPAAIALLHKTASDISTGDVDPEIIEEFDKVLGLRLQDLVRYTTDIQENIKKLSRERESHRLSSNWQEADRIRKELENMGYFVDDTDHGPRLRRKISGFS